MRIYTDSQARQQFTDMLAYAEHEEVMIKREDGTVFFSVLAAAQTITF